MSRMKFAHYCLVVALACWSAGAGAGADALTITGGYCQKNVSVKYQVPVTKTRPLRHTHTATPTQPHPHPHPHPHSNGSASTPGIEQYVDYEERVRWDTVHICCAGYRTLLFGFCEPICDGTCAPFSYCAEPNKCECLHGYAASHYRSKRQQLICRPVCAGGCPEHSHCVAPNRCECRPGYKDVSGWWFQAVRCERIQCAAPDQRYDVERRTCVKIEMSIQELMQKVAEKLARGLDVTEASDEAQYAEQELDLK